MKTYRCDINLKNGEWLSFQIEGHNHKEARRDALYRAKAIEMCHNSKLNYFTLKLLQQ